MNNQSLKPLASNRRNLPGRLIVAFVISLIISGSVCAQDTTLVQYTGKYIFPSGTAVDSAEVTSNGQSLVISATLGSATLSRKAGDEFSIPQYGGKVVFLRDAAKKISGIKIQIDAADINAEGKKVDEGAAASKPGSASLLPKKITKPLHSDFNLKIQAFSEDDNTCTGNFTTAFINEVKTAMMTSNPMPHSLRS